MKLLPPTPLIARLCTAAALSVAGAMVMIAILVSLGDGLQDAETFLPSAALGALLSGLLFAGFFGKSGRKASLWCLAGALLATGLGSFLGGVSLGVILSVIDGYPSGEPLYLLQIGAFAFLVVMLFAPSEQPLIVLLWLVLMLGVHVIARLTRRGPR